MIGRWHLHTFFGRYGYLRTFSGASGDCWLGTRGLPLAYPSSRTWCRSPNAEQTSSASSLTCGGGVAPALVTSSKSWGVPLSTTPVSWMSSLNSSRIGLNGCRASLCRKILRRISCSGRLKSTTGRTRASCLKCAIQTSAPCATGSSRPSTGTSWWHAP